MEKKNEKGVPGLIKEASTLVDEILGPIDVGLEERTPFGVLISHQSDQLKHISATYEEELTVLAKKIGECVWELQKAEVDKQKIKVLEREKRFLEECAIKNEKTIEGYEAKIQRLGNKNVKKKPKQKVSK